MGVPKDKAPQSMQRFLSNKAVFKFRGDDSGYCLAMLQTIIC